MVVPSSDYTYPPIDGSIPPALIIDFHLEHNPNQVFTILHDVENSTQTEITYEQLAHAVHRTAHILNPNGAIPQGTNIGFLLSTNTIEYLIAVMGAMRAGLVPFPVSPRTHVAGIAHLFTTTQTKHIAAGGSKAIDDVTLQLGEAFSSSGFDANFIRLPTLEEVLPLGESKVQAQHVPFAPLQPCGNDSIVTILHSSGSTGMPRPIPCHLEGIFKNLISQPVGWVYTGDRVGTMALPTFHIMGMMLQIVLPLYVGYTQVIFAPGKIPVMPTPDLTIKTIASTKCQFTIIVPLFLEAWARDESAIAHLREMKGVMFGGGTLAEVTGNKLVSQGVRMHSCYGGTEFGIVNVIRDQVNLDEWGYVQLSPRVNVFFDPQHDSDGTHEVVFVETGEHKPFVINSEVDGKPAYRTKDLVVRHPVKPDLWKFLGRLDDQIVLLNGEKTNPAPMEAEIVKSPLVRDAVMFGRERKQTGVLIELAPNVNSSSLADEDRTKLVEGIWPHVERANQVSSTHSRLDKSTIVVADPTRPLPRTPKATVSRSAALKLYAKEIEDMYASLEGDSGLTNIVEPPESWSELGIVEAWVGKCVSNILGRDVDPVGDLFQQGMDSLTATILLRTIKGALHKSPDPTTQAAAKQINQQTIFAKPTVQQLATVLVHLFTDVNDDMDPVAEALQSMRAIVDKYNSNWARTRVHSASAQSVQKECVVVTGTTGGLGSHLLAQLLANDKVNRVWALNRKSAKLNQTRQEAAFEDKLLDGELLNSTKLIMLDTDLEDAKLGLSDELYDEIRGRATIIVHNAWQVNFNLSLQSFEPSIRGARNLLDLAFSSTATTGMPRFVFTSSVSVVGLGGPEKVLREVPVKLEDGTRSIGYGQSKLVTEKLLESAREAGLQTCAIRLGQLAGDVKSGAWATTDWVPSVIASSVSVGCLPAAVGTVSWLPLDTAARSVIDVCASRSAPLPLVIHSSHPRPVPWMDIMTALSEALATRGSLRLVRFDEWNKRVTGSAAAFKGPESERYKRFPSTKIQSTVDTMVLADEKLRSQVEVGDAEACGTVRLDTAGGERLSKALKTENHIGREHVGKWVEYWAKKGLFVRGEFASVLSDASETVLEELKAIASYEAHLENSKKAIHRLRNRCTRIAPVNILPPELLTQIFYFAFQPECMFQSGRATNDLSVCQRLLITPLRVCSYWRYVALHSGVFWTHIDVGAAKPKESLSVKQAKCILPYSGGRPLDIHIKMAHNAGPLITPDIREFCILSAPKAALISLCNTDSQEDVHTAVIGLLLSNCTPGNLTHLASIYGVYRASSLMVALDTTEQIDPSVRCTRICVLHDHLEEVLRCVTSLHLKNRILHWKSKAYTGLVRLQVDHAFGIYTTSQLAHILNASPLLRFLRLGFSLIKDGNSAEPVPVQMEHLEALSLFADRLEDHDQVLRLIIPGSKAIRLSTVVTEEETPFLTSREHKRFFERSNVTQLHAVMAPVPVGDLSQPLVLSELLSLIPNLETLSLGMFDIVCGNRPSMSPGGTLYGERLTRLQLVDSAIDLDEICKIINEYPITRLAIELEADLLDLGDEISDEEAFKEELLEMFPDLEFFVQGDPNDVDWD